MIFYIGITINVLSVQKNLKNEAPHIHLVSWAQVTFKPHVDVLDRPLPKLRDSRCINVITFSIIQIILPRNTLDHKSIQLMTPVHLELSGHGTVIEVAGTIIRNMITGYCLSFFLSIWPTHLIKICCKILSFKVTSCYNFICNELFLCVPSKNLHFCCILSVWIHAGMLSYKLKRPIQSVYCQSILV